MNEDIKRLVEAGKDALAFIDHGCWLQPDSEAKVKTVASLRQALAAFTTKGMDHG